MQRNLFPLLSVFLFLFLFSTNAYAYYDIQTNNDAYSWEDSPSMTTGTQLVVITNSYDLGDGANARGYLGFNITSIPFTETITSAYLYLPNLSTTNQTLTLVYNTTQFWETNLTWANQPVGNVSQDNKTASSGNMNFSVLNAVKSSRAKNETLYLMLRWNAENESVQMRNTWFSKEKGLSIPYLRIETAEGSGCTAPDAYITGSACLNGTRFYTNDGCNYTLTDCPTGSSCIQLTSQMNVTNDLYENYTSCQITTIGGETLNCFNICYNNAVLISNCVEDGCKVCNDASGGMYYNGTYGYFTDTWYSNQSTVSVPAWTVACNYLNGTRIYYNETGDLTTEIEILTRAGNNVTKIYNASSATTTGDAGMDSLKTWINDSMNSSFGADLISLITAGVISVWVWMKTDEKKLEVILAPFLVVCGIFSFVGLLTAWFMILIGGLTVALIFFKVKGG